MISEKTKSKSCYENVEFKLYGFKILMLSILFIIFYSAFIISADAIHQIGNITYLSNVVPWVTWALSDTDGIEMYVMTTATVLYLLSGYLVIKKINIPFPPFYNKKIVQFFLFIISCILIYNLFALTKDSQNIFLDDNSGSITSIFFIIAIFAILSIIIIYTSKLVLPGIVKKILLFEFFLLLFIICLLVNDAPNIFDYCYLIGPANKILHGEKLGSFFIQYNLISTYLFVIMQKLNLQIHQMHIVYVFIFSLWILLYYKIASMIFKNKIFVYLFLLALIVIRLLAVLWGPVSLPQVSPLRMDLWVPLIFFVLYFGFKSFYTAISFALCYLADDVFGLMFLCLYILTILFIITDEVIKGERKIFQLDKKTILLLPALVVFVIHFLIFRSIGSSASKIYSGLNIGFIPISIHSLFWFIAWILPICLYILSQSKKDKLIYFFLFGIACIQFAYFFGRSHENNLRNISGIIIFIIFLSLDYYYSFSAKKIKILCFTILLIVGAAVNFNSQIIEKYENALLKIKECSFIEPHSIENTLSLKSQYLKLIPSNKIIIISDLDSYINYRLGYNQIGFFSPFCANFYSDKTITFLKSKLKQDYRLIIPLWGASYGFENNILNFNNTPLMITNKEQFILVPLGNGIEEIKLSKI